MRFLLIFLLILPFAVPTVCLAEKVTGTPKIIDGDTLDIGPTTIRIHGIDAPEVAQPGGRDATNALAGLIEGRMVTCVGNERDEHHRLIAKCRVAGADVGAAMVHDGHAWAFVKYSRDYVPLEQAARRQHVGIWHHGPPEPPWDYRAKRWQVEQQQAPKGCPIKGNIGRHGERIYHAPWSPWYRKTSIDEDRGERWFCSEREALDAGWRAPYWH